MVVDTTIASNSCYECGGYIIFDIERGETICEQCGLVHSEKELDINHSGTRAYTKQEKAKKEHNGTPISILVPNIELSTIIDRKKITNPDLKRAAKWNTHMTWEKRNMLLATTELKRIGCNLNFPEHIKKATIRLYKEVFKNNLLRGRSINGMIAACAYYICKQERIPITFQEIINESSISPSIIKKCYKTLLTGLSLRSSNMDPVSLVPKFTAELGLDIE
ncbi:MAG: hypothetical protein ACTSQJ_19255, partial [Promethearchaeota archaeon]